MSPVNASQASLRTNTHDSGPMRFAIPSSYGTFTHYLSPVLTGAPRADPASFSFVAVGMPVTRHPPHRSRRADFPHRAPASGSDAQSFLPYALLRALQVWGAATGVCRCLFLRFPVLCPSTTVHTFPLTDSVFSTCFAALHSLRPDSLPSTLSADHGAP